MTKYEEILNDLKDKIETGVYKKDEKLPSEQILSEIYGVSKTTIKKVMNILTQDGYIYRRRGDGSYVNDIEEHMNIKFGIQKQFGGFTNNNSDANTKTEVLLFEIIIPPENVAQSLKLKPNSYVYHFERLRYIDEIAQEIEIAYINVELIPGLTISNVESSTYKYIEEELNLKIKSAHRKFRAKVSTEKQRELLKMGEDVAILEYSQVVFLDTGMPFQYSISQSRGDNTEVFNIIHK